MLESQICTDSGALSYNKAIRLPREYYKAVPVTHLWLEGRDSRIEQLPGRV
jgi:hypothetical protein